MKKKPKTSCETLAFHIREDKMPMPELTRISSPEEMKLAVRRAFRRMPEQRALIAFAQVMTAAVSPELKLAAWEGVRYLHIWWMLDEVLTGDVLENPVVQTAFADAVPVRRWNVAQRCPGWEELAATLPVPVEPIPATPLRQLIAALTHGEDAVVAAALGDCPPEMARLRFEGLRGRETDGQTVCLKGRRASMNSISSSSSRTASTSSRPRLVRWALCGGSSMPACSTTKKVPAVSSCARL